MLNYSQCNISICLQDNRKCRLQNSNEITFNFYSITSLHRSTSHEPRDFRTCQLKLTVKCKHAANTALHNETKEKRNLENGH